MKRSRTASHALFASIFLVAMAVVSAQQQLTPAQQKAADMKRHDLDRTDMQPDQRAPVPVTTDERVPFAGTGVEAEQAPGRPTQESEEQKLRRVLSNMRVSGLSGTKGNYRILLGSMALKEGDTLPRLFRDQAETLRVRSISERQVTLEFCENSAGKLPRAFGVPFNLKPTVDSMMVGEVFTNTIKFDRQGQPNMAPMQSEQVNVYLEGAEKTGYQTIVERTYYLMGDTEAKRIDGTNAPTIPE